MEQARRAATGGENPRRALSRSGVLQAPPTREVVSLVNGQPHTHALPPELAGIACDHCGTRGGVVIRREHPTKGIRLYHYPRCIELAQRLLRDGE